MFYIKTTVARNVLTSESTRLTARERQIVLLCTGTRPTERLVDIFGADVLQELKQLEQRGLVRLLELMPAGLAEQAPPVVPTAPAPAAPLPAAPTPAVAVDVVNSVLSERAWLLAARGAALATLAQLEPSDEEVRDLIMSYQGAESENDVLMLVAQTVRVTLRLAGKKAAVKVSTGIGYLLPDAAVPRLLDCLLESSDLDVVAWLYERLLADSENLSLADLR